MTRDETFAFLQRYLRAIEEGRNVGSSDEFYTPDIVYIEHPNKLSPAGRASNLEAIIEAGKRGSAVIERQTFELESAVIEGDRAALQLRWSGWFKIDAPRFGIKAGDAMHARFAQFYTFRDGRISRQETYDCFEP